MKLRKLPEKTKIINNAPVITMDIEVPIGREEYDFLKQMNELGICVRGRFKDGNKILGFYSNGVKSIQGNNISLY